MTALNDLIAGFDPALPFDTPAHWLQGRTLYGGLSVALALEAAMRAGPPGLPPLRSAQVAFVGPARDGLTYRAQVLRQGKSATSIAVDGMADDAVAVRVLFTFAAARPSAIRHAFSLCPRVDDPLQYEALGEVPGAPASLRNFELRFAGPVRPVTGADDPVLTAWVRLRDAAGVAPALALMTLADSLPLAVMASLRTFAPVSTMTWSMDLAVPPALAAGDWCLLRSASRRAADGYSFQTMGLWSASRELLLSGSQTVAVFA